MKKFILAIPIIACTLSAGNLSLLKQETVEIPVAHYRTVMFSLPAHQSEQANIAGSISIQPDTASIELILLHIDDYMRWRSHGGDVDTLAFERVSPGGFELEAPGLGSYALILSSRSNFHPVVIILDLEVHYSGTGETGDPLPAALRLALLVMMAGVIAIAAGSVLSGQFRKRTRNP